MAFWHFSSFVRWSRANESLFATTGCPGKICSQLLIHHLGHPQVSDLFLPEHKPFSWASQPFQCLISQHLQALNVIAASDNGIDHRRFRPQLASDASSMRYRRWQKALFLDDWNVEFTWLFNKMFFFSWPICFAPLTRNISPIPPSDVGWRSAIF